MAMLTELTKQLHSFLFWVLLEVYTQETTVRDAVVLNKGLVCPHPLKIFTSNAKNEMCVFLIAQI